MVPPVNAAPLQKRLAALHEAALVLIRESSLELLLHQLAELARQLVDAQYAAVGVLDEERNLLDFIPVGMSDDEVTTIGSLPQGKGLLGVLRHTNQSIRLIDLKLDPRSVGFPANHPNMASFLGVPIWNKDVQVGQIYLTNKIGELEFSNDDQKVIETLASYAAISITNSRLYHELNESKEALTRRTENLYMLNQLASILATSTDIDEILDRALRETLEVMDIEVGELHLRQEDGQTFLLSRHQGSSVKNMYNAARFELGEGIIGQVAESGQFASITLPPSEPHPDLNPAILTGEFSQLSCFPLAGRGGILGTFSIIIRDPVPLDEIELQFMTAISAWMGTAVENLNLNTQQRRLAVLEERERIAMDLHDGIIQSIYAVGLTLEHARMLLGEDLVQSRNRISQAISDLDKTIRDIRSYILDLRPRHIREDSLNESIARLVAEFKANTFLDVNLQLPKDEITRLSEAAAMALFHICQEALANIAKHARAQQVEVVLWKTRDRVLLEISDDGRGFDMQQIKLTLGHGLMNIQTRAHTVGGDVEINTEPGRGTTILAWVPLGKRS